MTFSVVSKAGICACLFAACTLFAQDDSTPAIHRPSIGVRLEYYPLRLYKIDTVYASTTQPIADYTYTASTSKSKFAVSPTIEYRLGKRTSLGAEFHYYNAQYSQKTVVQSGAIDPNSPVDDRKKTTITNTTKADYWDVPLLLHYYGLASHGFFTHGYLSGGVQYRHVGTIHTGNEFSNADGTTNYNEIPADPNHRNQIGFVAGVGLRFVDDFKIKVAPEIRYVRWVGSTFQGPAYRAVENQVEAGLGISF
jgi:hypothetical protein